MLHGWVYVLRSAQIYAKIQYKCTQDKGFTMTAL